MENIATPGATARPAPTTLDLLVRGGVASVAYRDVERTLGRAGRMLAGDRPAPIAAYRALAARLGAHAEQLFRDHVVETSTTLPAGLTVSLPCWSGDLPRLTYRLLLTYRQQAEDRIRELRTATVREGVRAALSTRSDFAPVGAPC